MEDRHKYKVVVKNTIYNVENIDYTHEIIYYDTILRILSISFKDAKLIQCTGLKDKNGKLIYEGDIVKLNYHYKGDGSKFVIAEVKYEGLIMHFICKKPYLYLELHNHHMYINYEFAPMEIIGNIYENPELIEGDEE